MEHPCIGCEVVCDHAQLCGKLDDYNKKMKAIEIDINICSNCYWLDGRKCVWSIYGLYNIKSCSRFKMKRDFRQDSFDLANRLDLIAGFWERRAKGINQIYLNSPDKIEYLSRANAYRISASCIRRTMQTGKELLAGIDHIPDRR